MIPIRVVRRNHLSVTPSVCMSLCGEAYGRMIATELGVRYDSFEDYTSPRTGERLMYIQFTDIWDTGGTFCGHSLIHARRRLMEMKLAFRAGEERRLARAENGGTGCN